jgi:CDGSH-type Zn-finger protein
MAEPAMPRDNYYAVDLEPNKEYLWCACGYSKTQPFCDGSHQGTEFAPKAITVGEAMTLYLCGCKRTQDPPYCDGMHALI